MKKLCLFLFFYLSLCAFCQISVNPMLLFIDPISRSATLDVINATNEVREFKIELKFGYYDYDSLGKSKLIYNDTIFEKEYSLIPYVKMFPRVLIIPPKETQTVRFMVRNLPEDANKTYWTRFIASSDPVEPQIDTNTIKEPGKIKPKIVLRSEMNGQIVFNKGTVSTNVDFELIETTEDSNYVYLIFNMEKSGVSPCIGTSILKVFDNSNDLIFEDNSKFSLYKSSKVRFSLNKSSLKKGKIKVELTINSERKGIDKELQIPMIPKTKVFYFDY